MTKEKNKLTKKNQLYVDQIVGELMDGLRTIEITMAAALEPFRSFETVVKDLEQAGRQDDILKAARLLDTVRADLDIYGGEYSQLKTQLNAHIQDPPLKARHIGEFAMASLSLGQLLIDLNTRMLQSTVVMGVEFTKIIEGE